MIKRQAAVVAVSVAAVLTAALGTPALAAGTHSHARAVALKPAQVRYGFKNVTATGVSPTSSGIKPRPIRLSGNWQRTLGVNGKRNAVLLKPKSQGVINRSLDLLPRTKSFAAAITIKTTRLSGTDTPNVAQQGFFPNRSQWKMEILPTNGHIRCRFKGHARAAIVISTKTVTDGKWHNVVCFRRGGKIGVQVDGFTKVRAIQVGAIINSNPVVIGNKNLHSASDQFRGAVDFFSIALGKNAVLRALQGAPKLP